MECSGIYLCNCLSIYQSIYRSIDPFESIHLPCTDTILIFRNWNFNSSYSVNTTDQKHMTKSSTSLWRVSLMVSFRFFFQAATDKNLRPVLQWSTNALSIYLSMYLSISPCIDLCNYRCIYLSIYISIFLSIYLSIYLSISLSINLSICLSVYRSVCLSVYLSSHLSIYLSHLPSWPLSLSLSSNYLSIYYLSTYLSISLSLSSVNLSSCLPVYLCCSVIQCNVVWCSVS